MLDSLKQLGLFILGIDLNVQGVWKSQSWTGKPTEQQIGPSKVNMFCQTRWTETHFTLNVFDEMYEAIIVCLEAIVILENIRDTKTNGCVWTSQTSPFKWYAISADMLKV